MEAQTPCPWLAATCKLDILLSSGQDRRRCEQACTKRVASAGGLHRFPASCLCLYCTLVNSVTEPESCSLGSQQRGRFAHTGSSLLRPNATNSTHLSILLRPVAGPNLAVRSNFLSMSSTSGLKPTAVRRWSSGHQNCTRGQQADTADRTCCRLRLSGRSSLWWSRLLRALICRCLGGVFLLLRKCPANAA